MARANTLQTVGKLKRLNWARMSALSLIAALAVGAAACKTVEFYEKEHLSDPAMLFDDDPTESHFVQKCAYSREASVGGIGTGAGGGCGCY